MLPIIAIVGRANVGKSTLYNRLIGKREAITADWAGTTRDRLYGRCEWNGKSFMLVDTAGLEPERPEKAEIEVQEQIEAAILEAALLLFIVDTKTGITDKDLGAIKKIRLSGKPFIVVANKCDNIKDSCFVSEFHRLGTTEIVPVSAISGKGTGDLLDMIVSQVKLGRTKAKEDLNDSIVVAIAGRPNVGKSSLLNKLIGQERAVVSERAGTTRDSAKISFDYKGEQIVFQDTAGIRRKGRVGKSDEGYRPGQIEKYSVLRSLTAMERSTVVLVLIDATEGITAQDLHVLGYALEAKKSIVLVVNKWDTVEDGNMQDYLKKLAKKVSFLSFAPVVFTSATTGKNIHKIFDLILETHQSRFKRVPTSELNTKLQEDILKKAPPATKNILPNIKYISQVEVNPPTFVFFSNHPEFIHFSYARYLENRIRDHWDFDGTPISITFKKK